MSLPEYRTRWIFLGPQGEEDVAVSGQLLISNPLALRIAALDGLGPTLLPDWLIGDDIRAGRLSDLFPAYDVTATTFNTAAWLLYPSREYMPRKTRSAITFFRGQFCNDAPDPDSES